MQIFFPGRPFAPVSVPAGSHLNFLNFVGQRQAPPEQAEVRSGLNFLNFVGNA